jgi:hypothetical protein
MMADHKTQTGCRAQNERMAQLASYSQVQLLGSGGHRLMTMLHSLPQQGDAFPDRRLPVDADWNRVHEGSPG